MLFHLGLDDSTASVKGISSLFLGFSANPGLAEGYSQCSLVSHIPKVSDERVVKRIEIWDAE